MSGTYTPDDWHIIKLSNLDTGQCHYRVLCSWAGSYLYGSSWKISSGIDSVQVMDDRYIMPQTSGSVYELIIARERMSGIMGGILQSYTDRNDDTLRIDPMTIEEFLMEWKPK